MSEYDPFGLERVTDERDKLKKEVVRLRKIKKAVDLFLKREDKALMTFQLEDAIEKLRKAVGE